MGTDDGTDNGNLVEMRRVWVQDGKVIPNANTNMPGIDTVDSITDDFCGQTKVVFGDTDDHGEKGGLKKLGQSLENGHVLVMSEWDDGAAHMLWLDSNYPPDADPSKPGVNRGPCPSDSGDPGDVEANYPDATVTWSKIRVGTIGSTYPSGGDNPTPPTPRPTSNPTDQPTNPPNPQGGTISNPMTGLCLAVRSNDAVPNDYTNVAVAACDDGVCDKDGCDLNPWRLGDHEFYGPGPEFVLDTTKPFTVVTQFLTDDGTDNGNLVEMRRERVQDGKVIPNTNTNMPGIDTVDSITDDFCGQTKVVF